MQNRKIIIMTKELSQNTNAFVIYKLYKKYIHFYQKKYNAVALKKFSQFYCKRNKYYFQKKEKKNEIYS